MSNRFIIDCNGIIDTWNSNGKCEDKLTWKELCDTLNELDSIADEKLDEYELIVKLQKENQNLRIKLADLRALLTKIKHDVEMELQ